MSMLKVLYFIVAVNQTFDFTLGVVPCFWIFAQSCGNPEVLSCI